MTTFTPEQEAGGNMSEHKLPKNSKGYVPPIPFGWRKKHTIEVRDLNHPEAIQDLITLLKEVGHGESVHIKIL